MSIDKNNFCTIYNFMLIKSLVKTKIGLKCNAQTQLPDSVSVHSGSNIPTRNRTNYEQVVKKKSKKILKFFLRDIQKIIGYDIKY